MGGGLIQREGGRLTLSIFFVYEKAFIITSPRNTNCDKGNILYKSMNCTFCSLFKDEIEVMSFCINTVLRYITLDSTFTQA